MRSSTIINNSSMTQSGGIIWNYCTKNVNKKLASLLINDQSIDEKKYIFDIIIAKKIFSQLILGG